MRCGAEGGGVHAGNVKCTAGTSPPSTDKHYVLCLCAFEMFDYEMIGGLQDEDFECMQIRNPLHKRILKVLRTLHSTPCTH